MARMDLARLGRMFRTSDESHRVTTLELYFDLVFVFAFTQVTRFMGHEHSAVGVLQGLTILGFLWWTWVSYAWLANQTHVDEGLMPFGIAVALAAVFIVALVIPEAYHDLDGGLNAPLVLVIGYTFVRAVHLVLYFLAAGDDVALRRQVLRTSIALLGASPLLFIGALVGGEAQTWLWIAALVIDVTFTYVTSTGGNWRIHSPAHWAERFSLVIILALGESIVAVGFGAAEAPISWPILAGVLLAISLATALWWLYFDFIARAAERILAHHSERARASLAIDGYTYLHLLLIAGIIISALGLEEVMARVNGDEPLGYFGAAALLGGTSLYLAGHAFFWRRVGRTWKWWRLGGATMLAAAIPLAAVWHPLFGAGACVVIAVTVCLIEMVRYAEHRAEIRSGQPTAGH